MLKHTAKLYLSRCSTVNFGKLNIYSRVADPTRPQSSTLYIYIYIYIYSIYLWTRLCPDSDPNIKKRTIYTFLSSFHITVNIIDINA